MTTMTTRSKARNKEELVELITSTSFLDIILRNALETPEPSNVSVNAALDKLIFLHLNLFRSGMFVGFLEFAAVLLFHEPKDNTQVALLFIFFLAFLASSFNVLISFIAMEYFNGVKNEDPEFIIVGVQKYKLFFLASDGLLYASFVLFWAAGNLLAHSALPLAASSILHAISAIGSISLMFAHKTIIIDRQKYCDKSGRLLERHLYKSRTV